MNMKLKELRKEHKFTQKDIASKLFITQNCYSSYETKKREPNIEIIKKLADIYDVSIDYLLDRKFLNEVGFLTDDQKKMVFILKQLNEKNLNDITLQALKILDSQNNKR